MLDETILMKFLQGTCSEEELQQVDDYIKESGATGRNLFELRKIDRLLQARAFKDSEVDTAYERMRRRIALHEQAAVRSARQIWMGRIARVAASVAAIVVLGILMFVSHGDKMLTAQALGDSVTRVTLADGTHVWLRSGAELRYPKAFGDGLREVELSGEGYFEVTKDRHHPFVVRGNALSVKVLGTKFAFSSADTSSEVSLLEGSVQVDEKVNGGRVLLSPGQKASIDQATGGLQVTSSRHVYLNAVWHNDKIPFQNATLPDIIDELQYVYHVKIRLEGNPDTHTTYNGVVSRASRVEDVLKGLSFTLPITSYRQGNCLVVRPAR